jgi:hypothetical protein
MRLRHPRFPTQPEEARRVIPECQVGRRAMLQRLERGASGRFGCSVHSESRAVPSAAKGGGPGRVLISHDLTILQDGTAVARMLVETSRCRVVAFDRTCIPAPAGSHRWLDAVIQQPPSEKFHRDCPDYERTRGAIFRSRFVISNAP